MKKLLTLIIALMMAVMIFPTTVAAEEYIDTTSEVVIADWKPITKEYFAMSMDFVTMYSTDSGEYGNGCVGFFIGPSDATYALFIAHDANTEPCFAFNKSGDWGGTWGLNRTYLSDMGIEDGDTVNLTVICRKADGVFEASAYINGKQIMVGSDTVGTYVDKAPLDFNSVGLACKLISSSYKNINFAESDSPITYDAFKDGKIENTATETPIIEVPKSEPVVDTSVKPAAPAAPQTFDYGVIAAFAAVISLAGFVVAKKR